MDKIEAYNQLITAIKIAMDRSPLDPRVLALLRRFELSQFRKGART